MRYICYLSKERVDSLFESAFDWIVESVTDTQGTEKDAKGELGLSGLISWIKAGLSYGRKESKASQSSKRKTAVSRLEKVVEHIKRNKKVGDLEDIVKKKGVLDCDWYTLNTMLQVANWKITSAVVDLVGKIDEYSIKLSCSTCNFSGLYKEGDKYIPTSTNRYLFEGIASLPMNGLVVINFVDSKKRIIFATPLYLVLNPLNQSLGEYDDVEI